MFGNAHGRRAPLRPRPALDQRRHPGRQRHADRPLHRRRPVSGSIIGNAGNFPINRDQTDHQFVYNLTAQLFQNHSFKAGTDIRRQALDDLADNFSRGFWNFNDVCGGTTYATPYAAFLDGCVSQFQKGYGPFFLENRMNESNVYVQDDWRITRHADAEPRPALRVRRARRPRRRTASTTSSAPTTNNIEPRLGFAYAPTWESGFPRQAERRPGQHRFPCRATASTTAASSSRSSRRAAPTSGSIRRTRCSASHDVCRTSSTSRIRTSGSCSCPGRRPRERSLTLPDPDLEMPSTHEVEPLGRAHHAVELDAEDHLPGQPQRQAAEVRARQPAAVAARRSGHRRRTIRSTRRRPGSRICAARSSMRSPPTSLCAGTGLARHRDQRGLPGARADRRQRDQPARAAHERAPARPALHDQPADQQRRRVLVRRPRVRVGQAVQPRACSSRPRTRSAIRKTPRPRRRSSAPATATSRDRTRIRAREVAVPHAAPVHASTAATGCRSSRTSAGSSGRRSAAG